MEKAERKLGISWIMGGKKLTVFVLLCGREAEEE